ncbi:oligosaccharide flippase family protein [Gilvimarinus agarilyticus]|nr:oligosaccharide flippase family protein [Gilvimarinus agarilyticus]
MIQNLAFSSSSKLLIVVASIIFAPILSRIYTPQAYGGFSLFSAYMNLGITFAALGFDQALILPKSDKKFYTLSSAVIIITITNICILFPIVLNLPNIQTELTKLGLYIYLIPVFILIGMLSKIIGTWLIRLNAFKEQSIRSTAMAYGSKSFSTLYGSFVSNNFSGFIITSLLSSLAGLVINIQLLRKYSKEKFIFTLARKKLTYVLKKYKNYPLFNFPSAILGSVISSIPAIFLTKQFSLEEIGYMAFATSLLDMPIKIIGDSAITPILTRKALDLQKDKNHHKLITLFKKAYLSLTIISIPGFSVLIFLSPFIFSLAFGSTWERAGEMASILSIGYMFRLISTPNSIILKLLSMERMLLAVVAIRATGLTIALITVALTQNFLHYIWVNTFTQIASNIFFSFFNFNKLRHSYNNG